MKKIINKLISVFLAFALVIGYFPIDIVWANMQNNVTDLRIKNNDGADKIGYKFTLEWKNPTRNSDKADTVGKDENEKKANHNREGTKIEYRNATNNDADYNNITTLNNANIDAQQYQVDNAGLNAGNLFEYRARAYHEHEIDLANPLIKQDATNEDNIPTALYLTDMQVEAYGSEGELNVFWDNPQYNGKNVFGYNIYYKETSENPDPFPGDATSVSVKPTDAGVNIVSIDVGRGNVQRLSYDIKDSSIKTGQRYIVKIEPFDLTKNGITGNTGELRWDRTSGTHTAESSSIEIDGKVKPISFTKREYRVNDVYININLEVERYKSDQVRLKWKLPNVTNTSTLDRIEVYKQSPPPDDLKISKSDKADLSIYAGTIKEVKEEYITPFIGSEKVAYQILIYTKSGKIIKSTIAVYNPAEIDLKPTKPNILAESITSDAKKEIDLYWEAFIRQPLTSEEENDIGNIIKVDGENLYVDKNLTYRIYLSDSFTNLSDKKLKPSLEIYGKDLNLIDKEGLDLKAYNKKFDKFYTKNVRNEFEEKEILGNTTYYIKIVAERKQSEVVTLTSEPGYAQIYVPNEGHISKPQSLAKPPLRIKKNEITGDEEISQNEMTIEWRSKWIELYDDVSKKWETRVTIKNGNLIFGEKVADDEMNKFYMAESIEQAKMFFDKLEDIGKINNLEFRQVDLSQSDTKYEMVVDTLENIDKVGYDRYVADLNNKNKDKWTTITPIFKGLNVEYTITGLEKNTPYGIILRTYRSETLKGEITYLIATTLPDKSDVVITPVTPQLQEVGKTESTIEVKWERESLSLKYELAYSQTITENPENENLISKDTIAKEGVIKIVEGNTYLHFTVKNLPPSTTHYFWVRAIFEKDGVENKSEWSNLIQITTNAFNKPNTPTGFGLAAKSSIEKYNKEHDKELKQKDKDYIVVEWGKDPSDIVEIKEKSENGAEILVSKEVRDTIMVKFNSLKANTEYYGRVKTVIVSKKEGESYKISYSYVVQLSLDKKFDDAITFVVGDYDPNGTNKDIYSVESEWCDAVKIRTGTDSGEFDGEADNDLITLPTNDFDIVYDNVLNKLIYRFMSNKKNSTSNENFVDQRFISKLIQNKIYDYEVNLTNYDNKVIKTRVVEMPVSILNAFNENKISLKLITGNTTFKLNPGFINADGKGSNFKFSNYDDVRITISENDNTTPTLKFSQSYGAIPQRLTINVITPTQTYNVTTLGSSMNVAIKLSSRSLATDKNIGMYNKTDLGSGWERINHAYNNETAILSTKTPNTGNFSIITNQGLSVNDSSDVNYVFSNLSENINIIDVTAVSGNQDISVLQLNNLISSIANGKKDITLNTPISTEDYNNLNSKGILLKGSVVSREQGINALVKLYEIKTKSKISSYTPLAQTQYKDIKNAYSSYQIGLLKAGDLGFFGDENVSRPKDVLKFKEALQIIDIIIADSM